MAPIIGNRVRITLWILIAARMFQSPLAGRIGHGYAVDPFGTHAMSVTASVDMYLYHYRLHITSATYPVDATRIHTWWWQKAIVSKTLLQIFVFLAAGHMAMLQSTSEVSSYVFQKSARDCLHFRIKDIQCLNGLLRDPVRGVAHSTVLIASALLIIEALNADFESLKTHTQGLKTLISLIGGLEALEHMTLNTVYTIVNITAALGNSAPSLPILPRFRDQILLEPTVFNGRDIQYKCEVPTALAQLATGFHTAAWSAGIHPSIKYRIDVLRRLVIHHELGKLSSANTISATDNDLFVVWQHQMRCIHYASNTPNLSEPIRLNLLVYLFMRVSRLEN
ncbi:hypothetical protein BJX62DRAFT_244025 [Aspergillus germanicus]